MADVANLQLDVAELQKLLELAQRPKVKSVLSSQIKKIQDEISLLERPTYVAGDENLPKFSVSSKGVGSERKAYGVKLTNYAWDQSDKFVKVYVTLDKVHTIPAANIKCQFASKSMELSVSGLNEKNYTLTLANLLENIVADASHFKVKNDSIVIFMKKESNKSWSNITVYDKKVKDPKTPKMDEEADPSKGLMDMMKQMYDDGDDDMKRTIAKAWTESRNKNSEFDGM